MALKRCNFNLPPFSGIGSKFEESMKIDNKAVDALYLDAINTTNIALLLIRRCEK